MGVGRYWTELEIAELERLAAAHANLATAALTLGRSESSVRGQAYRLGVEIAAATPGRESQDRDDASLRALAAAGYSQARAATLLNRSRYSVHKRSTELGLYWKPPENYGPRYQPQEDVEVRRRIRQKEPATAARGRVRRSRRSLQRRARRIRQLQSHSIIEESPASSSSRIAQATSDRPCRPLPKASR
ncbi:MAG: hypothetical protein ACYDGR_07190 [Candidatus Dormibacteria bacterium]